MLEEVLVDAYGEDEQVRAFRPSFEDEAAFPFPVRVVGAEVEVVGVDDGNDRHRLVAVLGRECVGRRVSLRDVVFGLMPALQRTAR